MSVSYLHPSRLTVIEGDAAFWLPALNENFTVIDTALTPAIAAFPTSQNWKPGEPVWLTGFPGAEYSCTRTATDIFAGVTIGPSYSGRAVLVKMFGEVVVSPYTGYTSAHKGKYIAKFASDDDYSVHDDPLFIIGGFGRITGGGEDYVRVLLREGIINSQRQKQAGHDYELQPGAVRLTRTPSTTRWGAVSGGINIFTDGRPPEFSDYYNGAKNGLLNVQEAPMYMDSAGAHINISAHFVHPFMQVCPAITDHGTHTAPLNITVNPHWLTISGDDWTGNPLCPPANVTAQVYVQGEKMYESNI